MIHILVNITLLLSSIICCQVTRLERLRQTVAEFLLKVVPTGYSVGLVTFSSEANIIQGLTEITSQSTRRQLVNRLPTNTESSTAIGLGLKAGVVVSVCNDT